MGGEERKRVATGADNIDSRCEPSGINREEQSDEPAAVPHP